jgi:uncharacterized membrane protein YedE/YeeE
MSIDLVLLMAIAAVASALVLLGRIIGLRTILRHATLIDVGFALIAGFALHGSTVGILIAIVGGLVMALVLQTGRALLRAYDRGFDAAMQARSRTFWRDVTPQEPRRDPYTDPAMPHVDFGP